MAFLVTENWSGHTFSKRPPWTASREFVVTSNTPVDAAEVATAPGIPRTNDEYPELPLLLCEGSSIVEVMGPRAWKVRSPYSISPRGRHFEQYGSLLDEPMRVQWNACACQEEVDRDVDGNPLLNSAYDPFTGASRMFVTLNFRIWRYEPFFDIGKCGQYSNTVNSNTFSHQGVVFEAGTLKCNIIQPIDEYDTGAAVLRMGYDFEWRAGADANYQRPDPFQWRFLDKGQRAWYRDTASETSPPPLVVGQIMASNSIGQVVTDIRLDGHGVPIDPGYTVNGEPAESLFTPPGATIEDSLGNPLGITPPRPGLVATFLRYKRYREVDFSGLGIF